MKIVNIFIILLYSLSNIALARGITIGQRLDLTEQLQLNQPTTGQFAQLFVPDYFKAPENGKFTLVFHLHSASWAAEDMVYQAHVNAVLFNIHLGAFSSHYRNYFQDSSRFSIIQKNILAVLKNNDLIENPQIEMLIVTSFSAGYAGVREILKTPSYYDQIKALVLADGLNCDSDSSLMAEQMKDFLRFARDARDAKKIMFLTHSEIPTAGYESTTRIADYLLNGIGAQGISVTRMDEIGLQQSACDTGYFHLKGYAGDSAQGHLKHLYGMDLMVEGIERILALESTVNE